MTKLKRATCELLEALDISDVKQSREVYKTAAALETELLAVGILPQYNN